MVNITPQYHTNIYNPKSSPWARLSHVLHTLILLESPSQPQDVHIYSTIPLPTRVALVRFLFRHRACCQRPQSFENRNSKHLGIMVIFCFGFMFHVDNLARRLASNVQLSPCIISSGACAALNPVG